MGSHSTRYPAEVRARCLETGRDLTIRARQIINATGVWTERVHGMAGGGHIRVRASNAATFAVAPGPCFVFSAHAASGAGSGVR